MLVPDLDYLDKVRLVNYIRSESQRGNHNPDLSSKECFAEDLYLTPVLEDDALLYNLDELDALLPEEAPIHQRNDRVETSLVDADQLAFVNRKRKVGPGRQGFITSFNRSTLEPLRVGLDITGSPAYPEDAYFKNYGEQGMADVTTAHSSADSSRDTPHYASGPCSNRSL